MIGVDLSAADAAGWAGALTLVTAYAATSVGGLRPDAPAYQLMNLVGSIGLGAVARVHHAWPSFTVNVFWLLIAAVALRRSFERRVASWRPNQLRQQPTTKRSIK